jgi:hypothetical protein
MENTQAEIDKRLHTILLLKMFPETGSRIAIIKLRDEVKTLRNQLKNEK